MTTKTAKILTVRIPSEVHTDLKRLAVDTGKTIGDLVAQAVGLLVTKHQAEVPVRRYTNAEIDAFIYDEEQDAAANPELLAYAAKQAGK